MGQDVGGWGVKLEVLRLLVALTTNWRRVVQPHMPALLQHCWTLLHSCLPIYLTAVVLHQEDLDEGLVRPQPQSKSLSLQKYIIACTRISRMPVGHYLMPSKEGA